MSTITGAKDEINQFASKITQLMNEIHTEFQQYIRIAVIRNYCNLFQKYTNIE